MSIFGKCSESYTQRLTEVEMRDLAREAHKAERSISEFVRLQLRQYLYGIKGRLGPQVEQTSSSYEDI